VPHITIEPSQRVLKLTRQGDPDSVAKGAFSKLFRTFYAHADKTEKRHAGYAMARWPLSQLDDSKRLWRGEYAFPISETFPAVPKGDIRDTLWEGGMVAEILHVGTYDSEAADIAILKGFLARNGYTAKGYLEEVYVKGPGFFFKGSPANYRTLIRYPVDRIGEEPAPIARKAAGP
jgi:effector-binding domain-containing protein